MRISAPEIVESRGAVEYRCRVSSSAGSEMLWYRLPRTHSELISEWCDAALVGLLLPAMAQGEDIYCEGTLSERLYYNLTGPLQKVVQLIVPSLHRIRIHADSVERVEESGEGVATAFSGGIDSFFVLSEHHYGEVPPSFRLTHLIYNNVGSHGDGAEELFRERFERLAPVAERIGLPFIDIDSNLSLFYRPHPSIGFQQTYTVRNASIALVLQKGLRRFLFASSSTYEYAFVGPIYDNSYSDAVTLPLLSTDGLDLVSSGNDFTRVAKTVAVAEIEDSWEWLDVCVSIRHGAGNCSYCLKCLRTLLTLEIAERIDRYQEVFDLDRYGRNRWRYIASVLHTDIPMLLEIADFIRERRFKPPLSARAYALVRGPAIVQRTRRIARAIRSRARSDT